MKEYIIFTIIGISSFCANAEKFECMEYIETKQEVVGDTGTWSHNDVNAKRMNFKQKF